MELDYGFNGRPFWVRQLQNQVFSQLWQKQIEICSKFDRIEESFSCFLVLILDPQRNRFDFRKNSLNRNQELLDSRDVVEDDEDNHGFHGRRDFHGGLGVVAAPSPSPEKKRSRLTSPVEEEYAPAKMGESYEYQHHRRPATGSSRLRNSGGEIVEVHGGHIVRSTGRKDRHSKVCTAKGPRDRRVRLSAHTAIQFYDVQDRLGYDRPSKAVDWLIKKAKSAIDELAELPPWKPTATTPNSTSILNFDRNSNQLNHLTQHPDDGLIQNSSFLPTSLDSDSIAGTIKSFIPTGASSTPASNTNSPAMQSHQSFPAPEFLPRNTNQRQDLRLSLQSLQSEQANNMFLDGSGWPENQSGGFQRTVAWGGGDGVSAGYIFSSPPTQTTPFLQPLFGQTTNNQLFNNNSQRGPLQSSYTPSIRAWIDGAGAGAAINQQQTPAFHHLSSMAGFTSAVNGFLIPARIQGEQEEHDGISDKPSSASSDSRH